MGNEGAKTAESFDYGTIGTHRVTIETAVEAALKALNDGTTTLEGQFGKTAGTAMTGGAAEKIKINWESLITRFNAFASQMKGMLDNVGTASQKNASLEESIEAIVNSAITSVEGGAEGGAADATTSTYS